MGSIENRELLNLLIEQKVRLSRSDFYSFRQLINPGMKNGWWQREVAGHLQQFVVDMLAGKRPELVICAPPQHGKECALDTPVMTSRGWKNHGDLVSGDYVFHPSGKRVRVIANIPQPQPCTLEVTLSNNDKIKVHENHEWTVTSHDWNSFKTISTHEMRLGKIFTGIRGRRGSRYRYQLPITDCVEFGARNPLKIDPYFFGAWLGDGAKSGPIIYEGPGDFEVCRAIELVYTKQKTTIHKDTGVKKHTFTRQGITDYLRYYDVIGDKNIPSEFITTSKKNRLELLAGLIDTDGSLHKETGQYRFINTNLKIIDGIKTLLSSLGYSYSVTVAKEKRTDRKIKDVQDCYQVGFTPLDIIPCRVERKKSNYEKTQRKVSIVDISEITPVPGNCIQVDSPDGLYLVGKTMQPTHNSFQVIDLIAFLAGLRPDLKTIYASFSARLGIRANLRLQRIFDSEIYQRIFPETTINKSNVVTISGQFLRNREQLEYVGTGGGFRNTTIGGSITGESLDFGVIDDPIKGRAEANSIAVRNKAWDWLNDDFFTRFDDLAGFLSILTRWHVDDPIGRMQDANPDLRILSYPAIAENCENGRELNEPLFPEHKSYDFLMLRKGRMSTHSWLSLYQQTPNIIGGNIIKGAWFGRYTQLPKIKYRAIFGDTAQKKKESNDYQVAECWGLGDDGKLYLIDMLREKFEAYELEKRFPDFWAKHKADRSSPLRYFGIEDKSSGTELIQKMQKTIIPRIPVKAIPRNIDKFTRVSDVTGYIESGHVMIPSNAPWVSDFTAECEAFTADDAHDYDDQIDPMCDAISMMLHSSKPSLADIL